MTDRLSEIKARPAVIRTVLDVEWLIAEVERLKVRVLELVQEIATEEWAQRGTREMRTEAEYVAAAIRAEASK